MSNRFTNISIDYGSLLKEELERRGIAHKDFAEAFGVKPSNLSGILNGKRKIPVSLIPVVSEMLSVPESVIINAQKSGLSKSDLRGSMSAAEADAMSELDAFGKIVSLKSLLKDICPHKCSAIEKLMILRDHYELTTASALMERSHKLTENCFRRSDKTGLDYVMINTWVVKARTEAKDPDNHPDKQFDHSCMDRLVSCMSEILHTNKGNTPAKVKKLLNDNGIGYIELSKEPKASIDGYSFMLNGTPYIAVTRRFDRIDNYAFNIMHELGHIYCGHVDETGKINVAVPLSESNENPPSQEDEANKFAAERLIPNSIWFLAPPVPLNPYVIQKKYTQWARSKNLNPWIVLGRVSHETGMYRFTSDSSRSINKGKEGVNMTK
jgi:HTH-type transcriptional regulator/antitoxin HigA